MYEPARHGISHRQILLRLCLFIRITDRPRFVRTADRAKHAVDKPLQSGKTAFSSEAHRLITCCRRWHTVHIEQLVHTTSHNTSDDRLHLSDRCFGILIDHRIQFDHPLQCALRESADKRTALFFQILIFVQHFPECNMAVHTITCHQQQNIQYQFPFIDLRRISRGHFVLQTR